MDYLPVTLRISANLLAVPFAGRWHHQAVTSPSKLKVPDFSSCQTKRNINRSYRQSKTNCKNMDYILGQAPQKKSIQTFHVAYVLRK